MRVKSDKQSDAAEKAVRDIKRATRRHFSAEDKIRIVIAGLRGEDSGAVLTVKAWAWSEAQLRMSIKILMRRDNFMSAPMPCADHSFLWRRGKSGIRNVGKRYGWAPTPPCTCRQEK